MKTKPTPPAVPALRFPQFRNTPAWVAKRGDEVFDQVSDRQHDSSLPILAVTQEHGAIPREGIDYRVQVSKAGVENYKVVQAGEFIISLRSFQGGIEHSNYNGLCSPAYVILRQKCGVGGYFMHYLKTSRFIESLKRGLEGMRDGKMISYKQFSELLLTVPPSVHEQQKIADCLAAVDEIIAGQAVQLEALKKHKRGLIQSLFPAAGKTQPILRFPQFRNAPAWDKKRLSEMATKVVEKNRDGEVTRVLTNSAERGIVDQRDYFDKDIANKDNLSGYLICEPGDYVYNRTRSNTAPAGPVAKNRVALGVVSPLYIVFRFTNDVDQFFQYYFESSRWHEYITQISSSGVRHSLISITDADFMNMPLAVPSLEEQRKIAGCLAAVDEIIAEQTMQLEVLKKHKQGIMQQLFPSVGGAVTI